MPASGVTDATGRATLATGRGMFTVSASGAGLVTVPAHQISVEDEHLTKTLVITMRPATAQGAVSAHAAAEAGKGIAGVSVSATPGGASGTTDANGNARLLTGKGTFTLTFSGSGLVTTTASATVPDEHTTASLSVTMRPTSAQSVVIVKCVDENGNPLSGVTVTSSP